MQTPTITRELLERDAIADAEARADSILDDHLAPLDHEASCSDCGGLHREETLRLYGGCPNTAADGAIIDDDPMGDD